MDMSPQEYQAYIKQKSPRSPIVKDTALARVILVAEVLKCAEDLMSMRGLIWPLFYAGVFYLIFVGLLTLLFGYLEKKLAYYKI